MAIGAITLVSLLFLTASCGKNQYPEYVFDGKIGDEQVEFSATDTGAFSDTYTLRVVKTNGATIEYVDYRGDDLKLEWVSIALSGEEKTKYSADSSNPAVRAVVAEGQKQFDEYLKRILEIRTSPLQKK